MIEFFNYLNAIQPLSPEATSALLKVVRVKELRRGQVMLRDGEVCDKLTFVVKGLLKLYFETGTKEVVIRLAKENNFLLSAQSYYLQSGSDFSIRAIEDCIVLNIVINDLQFLLSRNPELYIHLLAIAQQQVAAFEQQIAMLLLPARERFERLSKEEPWLTEGSRITDKLLAAYIGVRANTVCVWRKGKRL